MSAAPRVSIVMNVYNGEDYLAEAIDSVFAQSFSDWELIFWDDCSSDGSAGICARYADDPRVRYVRHPERVSIAEARNQAIAEARGDWVAFLDQDDIWLPDKLAGQVALTGEDEVGMIYGRALRFDRRGRRSYFDTWYGPRSLPEGDVFAKLLHRPSFIALSTVMIRRSALTQLGKIPPEVVYCPDYYLCVHVARRWRAACLQALSCLYRVHPANMTHVYRKEIHQEILRIVEDALEPAEDAGPEVLRRRKLVHETWIGFEEIRGGQAIWPGVKRILSRGSLLYLTFRPLMLLGRDIRHWGGAAAMKYEAIRLIRDLGLLKLADQVRYVQGRAKAATSNRAFVRQNPGFAIPPADLAFDAYNHVDWREYYEGGLAHALVFAGVIAREAPPGPLSVLEWGCGPGRIIRHLPGLLADRSPRLTGTDYNERSIAWCKAHLPGIDFVLNGLHPPLPFADASFEVAYNFSVFTHLSGPVQKAWAEELWRVLKPGGILISTTHGERHRYLLTSKDETARYDAGEVVTQEGYDEGKKWFFAIHPHRFVRDELLAAFEDVRPVPVDPAVPLAQEVWVAKKPLGTAAC